MFPIVQWTITLFVPVIVATAYATNLTASLSCEEARLRCAYRTGCGAALQEYIAYCAADLLEDVTTCPENCKHALIGLTSTDQGKELMRCECDKGDTMCEKSKQTAEICRASVLAAINKTRVSCKIATSICNADVTCSTALYYYNIHCKSLFAGKKCTSRCRNAINILARQEKAKKLNTCICDGAEDYDCKAIHRNMKSMCFKKSHPNFLNGKEIVTEDTSTNEISVTGVHNMSSGINILFCRTEILLGLVLLLLMSKD